MVDQPKIALDYDTSKISGEALKAAGYTEVFRYLTDLDNPAAWPKGMTLPEVENLRANGIKININRETTEKFMLGGYDMGYLEAKRCRAWARRLGFSDDEPIIYSYDAQVTTTAEQMLIDAFNDGAASVDGKANVGNYGQYSVVKRCLDRGYGGKCWQITNSWSWDSQKRLQKDPRAYAYQLIGTVIVAGYGCDKNELNPLYQNASNTVTTSTIPATIAEKWARLAKEFPSNATFEEMNALIWADAAARYAAYMSDDILKAVNDLTTLVKSLATVSVPTGSPLSDADKDDIANRVITKLGGLTLTNGIAKA